MQYSDINSPGFLARRIVVDLTHDDLFVALRYVVDGRPVAALPAEVGPTTEGARDLIAAAGAVYLGSLALARQIVVIRPVPAALLHALSDIAEMLYDIRRWRERLPLDGPPKVRSDALGELLQDEELSVELAEDTLEQAARVWKGEHD